MSSLKDITILVPGRLHDHAVKRIGQAFRIHTIDKADPALISADLAAGV